MTSTTAIRDTSIRAYLTYQDWAGTAQRALWERLDYRDERGDVAPRTVGIAVMAALAISVGSIITLKVRNKANAINLNGGAGG